MFYLENRKQVQQFLYDLLFIETRSNINWNAVYKTKMNLYNSSEFESQYLVYEPLFFNISWTLLAKLLVISLGIQKQL